MPIPFRISLLVFLVAGAACERRGGSGGSGALSGDEKALFAHLPADANVVFGGDYERFMKHWDSSPLKKFSESALAEIAGTQDGMRDYMTCWVEEDVKATLAGSMKVAGLGVTMNMVFGGLGSDTLTRCADKGGLKYRKDEDGKYIELQEIPDGLGGTSNLGYYYIDSTTAYFSVDIGLGGAASGLTREDLEGRLKSAARASAADSSEIEAMVKKADRSRAFWFAGSARGTPLASNLDGGYGWFDLDKNSMTFAFSAELKSASAASDAVKQFNEMSKGLALLPPDLRQAAESVLEKSKLTSSGKTLNGHFEIPNDALAKALSFVEGMAGGL
jgi:hypothetical protein